ARPYCRDAYECPPSSLRSNSEFPRPAQAVLGLTAGTIFAADPVAVSELLERREDRRVIDLALVGLVARRHRRDLDMPDRGEMLLETFDQIAPDDLRVIEIELDAHVRLAHLGDNVGGVLGAGEEIVGTIARIDRLDQQRDPFLRGAIGGTGEIAD